MMRSRHTTTITLASGKGGVGKTNVAVNLAVLLSQRFKSVCLLDSDIGMANVDVLLGLESEHALTDVVTGVCSFDEALIAGPGTLNILSGGTALERYPELSGPERDNLLQTIKKLQQFDITLIDSPAGASRQVIQMLGMAHLPVVVVTPEPTSLTDAYALIKLYYKKHKRPVHLCLNRVKSEKQATMIYDKLNSVTQHYLNRHLNYLGSIPDDPHIPYAVASQSPLVTLYPESSATFSFQKISDHVAGLTQSSRPDSTAKNNQTRSSMNTSRPGRNWSEVQAGRASVSSAETPSASDDLLRLTLSEATSHQATDIHIDPGPDAYCIHLRINKKLIPLSSLSLSTGQTLIKHIKSHVIDQQANVRSASSGLLRIADQDRQAMMRIRACFVQTMFGENAVLSFMNPASLTSDIKTLEINEGILDSMAKRFFKARSGLCILNGPRHSKISKTRSILLEHFTRKTQGKTISIEQHVKHVMSNVVQIEACEHDREWLANMTAKFRSQDVDTVSLDLDAPRQSFATAMDLIARGFKVLITTHFGDCISALAHYVSFCRESHLLPLELKCILSQQDLPGMGPSCREQTSVPSNLVQFLNENEDSANLDCSCGQGCDDCRHTGQKGRGSTYEYIPVTRTMREKIVSGHPLQDISSIFLQDHACLSLDDDGQDKVSKGLITLENLVASTN